MGSERGDGGGVAFDAVSAAGGGAHFKRRWPASRADGCRCRPSAQMPALMRRALSPGLWQLTPLWRIRSEGRADSALTVTAPRVFRQPPFLRKVAVLCTARRTPGADLLRSLNGASQADNRATPAARCRATPGHAAPGSPGSSRTATSRRAAVASSAPASSSRSAGGSVPSAPRPAPPDDRQLVLRTAPPADRARSARAVRLLGTLPERIAERQPERPPKKVRRQRRRASTQARIVDADDRPEPPVSSRCPPCRW